jgi:hypothetical protein
MPVAFTPTTVANPTGVQGSYPLSMAPGREGSLADLQAYVSRSYVNQGAAAIPFGAFAMIDTTAGRDPLAVMPAAGNNTFARIVGIAVDSNTYEGNQGGIYTRTPSPLAADGRMGYPQSQMVNVLSKGVIWVFACEAVTLASPVHFFHTDRSGTIPGAFVGRFHASAAAGFTATVAGARWLSRTTAAGLALLEIDMPGLTFTANP